MEVTYLDEFKEVFTSVFNLDNVFSVTKDNGDFDVVDDKTFEVSKKEDAFCVRVRPPSGPSEILFFETEHERDKVYNEFKSKMGK